MSKTDLIELVAEQTGSSKAEVGRILDASLDGIADSLKKGNKVTIVGFGTFGVSKREARDGRNPKTGETIKIAARNAVSFKAGSKLKDAVN